MDLALSLADGFSGFPNLLPTFTLMANVILIQCFLVNYTPPEQEGKGVLLYMTEMPKEVG